MTQQFINLGAQPDDNTGDDARTGGRKINENFSELYGKVQNVQNLNLTGGPVTALPAGSAPTATITGTYPNHQLALGLPLGPTGLPGAGAPTSADILAIAEMNRLERSLAAAGVPDDPSLIIDFIRGVHFASKTAIAASIETLIAALLGSSFSRGSTATYFDSDGLLKTAAVNVPCIDYDPVTRELRGLLVQPLRTNLLTNSVTLSDVTASVENLTRTGNAAPSPDGLITMSRFTSTITGGVNTAWVQQYAGVMSSSLTRTFSLFIRPGNTPKSLVVLSYGGGTPVTVEATIDWATKTIIGGGNPTLVDCGGGLFRAAISLADNNSGNGLVLGRLYLRGYEAENFIGDFLDTGCWQIEEGPFASSYIPTGASAVTRASDDLRLGGAPWFKTTGITVLTEFQTETRSASRVAVDIGDPTGGFGATAYLTRDAVSVGANPAIAPVDLNISVTNITLLVRASLRLRTNDAAMSVNGGAVATDTAVGMPTGPIKMTVGAGGWGVPAAHLGGHIRRIMIFDALTNAKVQALSDLQAWR